MLSRRNRMWIGVVALASLGGLMSEGASSAHAQPPERERPEFRRGPQGFGRLEGGPPRGFDRQPGEEPRGGGFRGGFGRGPGGPPPAFRSWSDRRPFPPEPRFAGRGFGPGFGRGEPRPPRPRPDWAYGRGPRGFRGPERDRNLDQRLDELERRLEEIRRELRTIRRERRG